MKTELGISLVELLVSLLLSSFIMAALLTEFLQIKQQYLKTTRSLENLIDLQLVTDLIRDSSRRAGFTPCASLDSLASIHKDSGRILRAMVIGPDQLTISSMDDNFFIGVKQNAKQLLVEGAPAFVPGQLVIVSDCFQAEVHRVKASSGSLISFEESLAEHMETVYLGAFIEERFFIQKNDRGQKALYYEVGHAEELSNLIHQLQVSYQDVLRVNLGMVQGKALLLETRVRSQ